MPHSKQILRSIFILSFIFFIGLNASAQIDLDKKWTYEIQGGLNFGGQISSNNFTYKSGSNVQFSVLKSITEQTKLGLGIGQVNMRSDYFYPLSLRLESTIFKNQHHSLFVQSGYSFAQTQSEETVLDLELEGGFFIEVGRMWSIPLNSKLHFQSAFSFTYQLAEMEYESPLTSYEESVDYVWAQLRIGLAFQ